LRYIFAALECSDPIEKEGKGPQRWARCAQVTQEKTKPQKEEEPGEWRCKPPCRCSRGSKPWTGIGDANIASRAAQRLSWMDCIRENLFVLVLWTLSQN
jgi:hypothetical protein